MRRILPIQALGFLQPGPSVFQAGIIRLGMLGALAACHLLQGEPLQLRPAANIISVAGGSRSIARVFDWDGDGLKDVVCSSLNGVYWCRNTNSNSNPILQAKVPAQAPVAAGGLANIYSSSRMRLDLVDWNNDGVMDLILGNADGSVYYYQGYRFAFTGIEELPGNTLALRWNSAPYLKYNLMAGDTVTNIQEAIAANLPAGGTVSGYTNQAGAGRRFFRVSVAQ